MSTEVEPAQSQEPITLFARGALFTLPQVAEGMNVSLKQVQRWTYSRRLRSVKLGGVRRILGADANRLVNDGVIDQAVEQDEPLTKKTGRAAPRQRRGTSGRIVA